MEVAGPEKGEEFGLTVQSLTPEIAENLGVEGVAGVVVTAVESESPAEDAGLRRGDIILEVNRSPVESVEAYLDALKKAEAGKNLLFLVRRGDNTIFLALKPPAS
jgi:serine protease Do